MSKNIRNNSTKTIINISVDGVDAAGVVGPTGAQGPAGTSITSIKQWYFFNSVTNMSNGTFMGQGYCDSTEAHSFHTVRQTCRLKNLFIRSEFPVDTGRGGGGGGGSFFFFFFFF
jgi:hypothetical protein